MSSPISDVRTVLLCELQSLVEDSNIEASNRLLVASQVRLLFGVCERTVRVWASKKQLPAVRTPSGRWKFPAREIMGIYKTGLQVLKE